MSASNNDHDHSGSSDRSRSNTPKKQRQSMLMDSEDLLKMEEHDVERGWSGVMSAQSIQLAPDIRGPIDHGLGSFSHMGGMSFGDQFQMPLRPLKKPVFEIVPVPLVDEELELPMDLGLHTQFDSIFTSEAMSESIEMEEECYDAKVLDIMEPHEYDCKTGVVSSRSANEVREGLHASLHMLGSDYEVSFQSEGYYFTVNVNQVGRSGYLQVDVSLLATGEEFRCPNQIAVIYNKLRGDGHMFQRFYRKSVAALNHELKNNLRALDGNYLPSEKVLEDEFDTSGLEPTSDEQVLETCSGILARLKSVQKAQAVGSVKQLLESLNQIGEKHQAVLRKFAAKEPAFPVNLKLLLEKYRDNFGVVYNISCVLSSLLNSGWDDIQDKAALAMRVEGCQTFSILARIASEWTNATGEATNEAGVVTSEIGNVLASINQWYYDQRGVQISAKAKSSLKEILAAKGDFERLKQKVRSIRI